MVRSVPCVQHRDPVCNCRACVAESHQARQKSCEHLSLDREGCAYRVSRQRKGNVPSPHAVLILPGGEAGTVSCIKNCASSSTIGIPRSNNSTMGPSARSSSVSSATAPPLFPSSSLHYCPLPPSFFPPRTIALGVLNRHCRSACTSIFLQHAHGNCSRQPNAGI